MQQRDPRRTGALCQGPECSAVIDRGARYCSARCRVEAEGYPEHYDYEALILAEDEEWEG